MGLPRAANDHPDPKLGPSPSVQNVVWPGSCSSRLRMNTMIDALLASSLMDSEVESVPSAAVPLDLSNPNLDFRCAGHSDVFSCAEDEVFESLTARCAA